MPDARGRRAARSLTAMTHQILTLTALGLRSLPQRFTSSLMVVVGIAGVVTVLLCVMALGTGFQRALDLGASSERAIILSHTAESEATSTLSRAAVDTILATVQSSLPDGEHVIASAEVVAVASVVRKSDGLDAYVTLRGVGSDAFQLRPEIRILAGRSFRPAVRELVVGRAAQQRFSGLELGDHVLVRDGEWTIVGVFESGGSSHESTLLADAETLLGAYQLNRFSSVTVARPRATDFRRIKDALSSNPTLEVNILREVEYLASRAKPIRRLMSSLAYVLGGVMGLGAVLACLNTMYAAVSGRSAEIATLSALGFRPHAIIFSVLAEALLLALVGAVIGSLIAFVFFHGRSISTIGGTTENSQLIYQLSVTLHSLSVSLTAALLVGFIGGLIPALQAAHATIASSLRSG